MTKKIKGQKVFNTVKAVLPSVKFTFQDLLHFITRSNITDIQNAIIAGESIDIIKGLLQNEKDTSILSHFLLNKPVLDPSKLISGDTSYTEVLKSKFPVIGKYLTGMTTLRKICTENDSKEGFKFLLELELEQKNPQKNLAELVVYLVDYTILNPKSNHGFLDVMAKYEYKDEHGKNRRIIDEINLNQSVFIPYRPQETSAERTDASDNDVREPSVSSSNSQKLVQLLSPDRVAELYRHSIQQEQERQNQGETVTLGEFLEVVKASKNPKIAAFAEAIISSKAEAIMPSKNFVGPNLTQHLTQPRECPQR